MVYRSFSVIPGVTDNIFSDRFDRIDRLFSRLTGDAPLSDFPSYNLFKTNENHYHLIVSVPGYKEKELDISLQNGQLTISGKREKESLKNNVKWLHQGISGDEFSLSFNLHNRVKVQNANLENGLLKLKLKYEIPEEEKPQKISIGKMDDKNPVIEHRR